MLFIMINTSKCLRYILLDCTSLFLITPQYIQTINIIISASNNKHWFPDHRRGEHVSGKFIYTLQLSTLRFQYPQFPISRCCRQQHFIATIVVMESKWRWIHPGGSFKFPLEVTFHTTTVDEAIMGTEKYFLLWCGGTWGWKDWLTGPEPPNLKGEKAKITHSSHFNNSVC